MSEEPQAETQNRYECKIQATSMFRGRMMVTVVTPSQAIAAEEAGACAVIPLDAPNMVLKTKEGALRATSIAAVNMIMDRVLIPVVGRVRVGHIIEAKAMEAAKVSCIDEHELINPITTAYVPETTQHIAFKDGHNGAYGYVHKVASARIYKQPFRVPFMCGASDLGEALTRIQEGASVIRTAYPADEDTHEVAKTFETVRKIADSICQIVDGDDAKLYGLQTTYGVSIELLRMVKQQKRLPVPFFAAGGVFMPVDVAMLRSMGCDGVIVSMRVFKTLSVEVRLNDIMTALAHYDNPDVLAEIVERSGGYGAKPTANG
ncbi:hypothetical protein IWW51_004514 [Coemansia sp. RSA 2702]|nr:hypothetical protein IWW51_004514 [Coemansia sp. RSA 2702]